MLITDEAGREVVVGARVARFNSRIRAGLTSPGGVVSRIYDVGDMEGGFPKVVVAYDDGVEDEWTAYPHKDYHDWDTLPQNLIYVVDEIEIEDRKEDQRLLDAAELSRRVEEDARWWGLLEKQAVTDALTVFVLDPDIRPWVEENDPQAMKHARGALGLPANDLFPSERSTTSMSTTYATDRTDRVRAAYDTWLDTTGHQFGRNEGLAEMVADLLHLADKLGCSGEDAHQSAWSIYEETKTTEWLVEIRLHGEIVRTFKVVGGDESDAETAALDEVKDNLETWSDTFNDSSYDDEIEA